MGFLTIGVVVVRLIMGFWLLVILMIILLLRTLGVLLGVTKALLDSLEVLVVLVFVLLRLFLFIRICNDDNVVFEGAISEREYVI